MMAANRKKELYIMDSRERNKEGGILESTGDNRDNSLQVVVKGLL